MKDRSRMNMRTKLAATVVGMSMSASWCAAQAPISPSEIPPAPGETTPAAAPAEHAPAYAHPTLPSEDVWPGVMIIIVAGMFVMAIGAGIVRHNESRDEEPPSAHGHDDHGHAGHGHDAHAPAPDHGHH
jgi:hypothetical protein